MGMSSPALSCERRKSNKTDFKKLIFRKSFVGKGLGCFPVVIGSPVGNQPAVCKKFRNWPPVYLSYILYFLMLWKALHIYPLATGGNQNRAYGTQTQKQSKNIGLVALWNVCSTGWPSLSYLYTCQPLPDSREALLGCDVIQHNHTVSLAKELFGDASISAEGKEEVEKKSSRS